MSDVHLGRSTLRGRRALALGAAVGGVLLLLGGGTLLRPEPPAFNGNRTPLVGRTTTICTTSAPVRDEPAGKTEVSAVAIREAADRSGLLTASTLASKPPGFKITQQGKGAQLQGVNSPMVISGEGAMASASNAVIVGDVRDGQEAGLRAAPCLAPAVLQWFSGLGTAGGDRTELILTNPDDSQAQVDLRFYGPNGRIAVPGSPGYVIPAHQSRPIALDNALVKAGGPLSVAVGATQGRVTAVAKRSQREQNKPAGVDWQIPSAPPSPVVVIPGVPEDAGKRQLVVTNPGNARATVGVQVLGFQGPYEPKGAGSLEVPPESTATVDLEGGLAGTAGSIKLTSDVPVTGAVISTSRRGGAAPDLAIQSAAAPLIGTGISAIGTSNTADSELIVSNAGDADVQITFEVFNYGGVMLRTGDMLLGPNSTATRRLNSPAPSYVTIKVPDGSSVVGGVVLTQPQRKVAGLATIPLVSNPAGRAAATRADYSAGR